MNIKWVSALFCALGLVTVGFMYRQSAQPDLNVLVVGTESAFPPFEMLDADGTLVGFDCDVIQAVARTLGKTVQFKIMSFENLIIALQQKKVDLIIACISITEPRKAAINLVPYHQHGPGSHGLSSHGLKSHGLASHEHTSSGLDSQQQPSSRASTFPLVFWKSIPKNVTKIEDLAPLHSLISVQSGSIQKDLIETYPFLTVRQLDTIPDLIMDIKYGKSLACMLEPVVLESIQEKYPEIKVLEVPIPPSFTNEGHGIGIRKEDSALTKQVAQAVESLQQDGTLKALEKKWLQHFSPSL